MRRPGKKRTDSAACPDCPPGARRQTRHDHDTHCRDHLQMPRRRERARSPLRAFDPMHQCFLRVCGGGCRSHARPSAGLILSLSKDGPGSVAMDFQSIAHGGARLPSHALAIRSGQERQDSTAKDAEARACGGPVRMRTPVSMGQRHDIAYRRCRVPPQELPTSGTLHDADRGSHPLRPGLAQFRPRAFMACRGGGEGPPGAGPRPVLPPRLQ